MARRGAWELPEAAAARALIWLEKYCGRFTTPVREVLQARKVLPAAVGTIAEAVEQ